MARPKELLDRWSEGESFAWVQRMDFWLNHEYFHSRQWITTNSRTGLPMRMSNSDNRIRVTYNKIGPNGRTLIGKFVANPLVFDVTPNAADDASIRGARLAQYVVREAAEKDRWETSRKRQVQHTMMGASSLALLEPAGPKLEVVSGKPAPLVAKMAVYPLPSYVCEPGAMSFEAARWFITQRALPCDHVRDHYGLNYTPKADTRAARQVLAFDRTDRRHGENLCSLLVMYERPVLDRDGKKVRDGRIVHATARDTIVEEPWPYPFDDNPGYNFMVDDTSDSWLGETFWTEARSPQDSLNYYKSLQAEAGRAMVPKLAVPEGFDLDQINDDPALPYRYDPSTGGDAVPRWVSGDSGTLRMRYDIETAAAHIDEVMHVHDISRGVAGERASGSALAILAEKDDDPLSTIANDQKLGYEVIGSLYLQMAEKMITSEVIATITVGRSRQEVRWTGEMLANQTAVSVPKASTQPHSRAARNKTLIDAAQALPDVFAALSPIQKIAMFDLPDLPDVAALLDPDVEKAQRENWLMAADIPCLPAPDEDHAKHLAEHRGFRQSAAYASLDPDCQDLVVKHERAHDRLLEQEVVAQRELNEEFPGASTIPSSLNMIGQVGPEPQPVPYK